MDIMALALAITTAALTMNIAIASYGIFTDRSLLKKLVSLIIFSDTLSVFTILVGFRLPDRHPFPSPPIHPETPGSLEDIVELTLRSVDPIPQAFIITAIVINLAVFSFLSALLLQHYKHFETLSVSVVEKEEIADEVY